MRRNYEDVYGDPGSPLTRRTQWGTYAIARITPDPHTLDTLRQAAQAAAEAAAAQPATANGGSANGGNGTAGRSGKAATLGGLASGEGTWLLMEGTGASPDGNRPFLDLLHLESGGWCRGYRRD